jgi:hypothetical protein
MRSPEHPAAGRAAPHLRFTIVAAAIWLVFVGAAYVVDAGLGFQKDDFAWIRGARQIEDRPLTVFTGSAAGTFYRPIVTLSFLADYQAYGLTPRGYAVTNLLLFAGCASLVGAVTQRVTGDRVAAATGVLVWTLNPHGVNMALLWLSGRTSLLMALFSCGAILAFFSNRRVLGTVLFLGALGSKEDAVALPLIVLACRALAGGAGGRALILDAVPMAASLTLYFWLRDMSGAMTPATAPSFYRLTAAPSQIAANVLSYVDRAGSAAAAITLLAAVAYATRPRLTPAVVRALAVAAVWFGASIAITVLIPVRSSLYALFPSIGWTLACAAIVAALRRGGSAPRGDRRLAAGLMLCVLLVPIYRARNVRWVEPAIVSNQALQLIAASASEFPDTGVVVFEDGPARFANFRDAFGSLGTEAVQLHTGKDLTALVLPPGSRPPVPGEVARYRIVEGKVAPATAARPR